jgi:predicted metal-dependent phosphotriesterase family hydrolase
VLAPAGHAYWPLAGDEAERAAEAAMAALAAASAAGIASVVDVTPIEAGRDLALLARAAAAAGVNVICSTGLGAESEGVSPAFRSLTAVQLADVYIAELTDAVPGTSARAGAISVAAGREAGELDDRAALAAAFAHAETGAPVLARAVGPQLPELVDRLVGRGIDPDRLVACDLDAREAGWSVLAAVAKRGARLGFTYIGDDALDEDARAATIAYALRRYGPHRVCVGSGSAAWTRELPGAVTADGATGGAGYPGLLKRVASFGVPADLVREALADAPRALFLPLREAAHA